MPTGQTPTPQIKRGKDLPYGEATTANEMLGQLAPTPGIQDAATYQPQGTTEGYIYGPTDRPQEPITAGAPFGPGPYQVKTQETPQDFIARVAQTVASGQGATTEVKAFAARVARGD
ncbi:hypothetical protein EPO05_06250 [Patescibacteria group bacterium]|nr:MAG: hypothetical protein EPO05_06250 [Patescibacteria group bacterium]